MTQPPAERGSAARSPKAIGHYAIKGRLGKGAMGVVYHAIDRRNGMPVALKVIASDLEADEEVRARFFREVVVAGQLRHRNIVSVVDSGEEDGRLYLAMELLTGTTLGQFLPQPEAAHLELRVDLMIQMCQGLMVAHESGIYHRDIKPGNLFVSGDHRLKILDFGVARLAGSNMTVTGYVLGTPDFMSPEQARGTDVDERSDVFSAGAVFYLMLTGRKPFAASDLPAVLTKVLRENPQPISPDEAPKSLATVIHKALSKSPAGRQQNMAELTVELMRAADEIVTATVAKAAPVRRLGEELLELDQRRTERRGALGLPNDGATEWEQLVQRYPMLRRGPGVLGVFPVRSAIVTSVESEIEGRLSALRSDLEVLDEAHTEWSRGCVLLSGGQEADAMAHLSAARRLIPESPAIARAIQASGEAAAARRDRQARVAACMQQAEAAAARRDWEAVAGAAADLEMAAPGHADAERLRKAARQNLEVDRQRHAREHAGRQAQGVLQEARDLADAGRFDDAISRLEAHELANPNAPGVADAIATLRNEHETARSRTERLTDARRLAESAARALDTGSLEAAERDATRSLSLNAESSTVSTLLNRIRLAKTERDQRDARARRLGDLIERATSLAERQKHGPALALLDEALSVDPSNEQVATLRARLAAEAEGLERQAEEAALEERKQRAAAPAIREARRALAAGDFRRARTAVDVALAHAPGLPEVLALVDEISARIPPPTAEDTVRVEAVDAQDDTAKLEPGSSTWGEQLRDRAAGIVRRWKG